MSRYPIPKARVRLEYQMSNSRFITTLDRAESVAAAKTVIHAIRAEMPDATHHVYAFRVGYGSSVIEGMSDDGEPSGTAGPPTLKVLRGAEVGDVVLVITRYFGGTKLGTGGLVYAYTNAAKEGLAALPTELKIARKLIGVSIPYHFYERLKQFTEKYEGQMEGEEFEAEITRYIRLPEENIPLLAADLRELSAGKIAPVILED